MKRREEERRKRGEARGLSSPARTSSFVEKAMSHSRPVTSIFIKAMLTVTAALGVTCNQPVFLMLS
jgi:hypothetical protein